MGRNYAVVIEEFAERHFIKSFRKKYKTAWDITERAIVAELERVDNLLLTDRAETITSAGEVMIIKTSFRIANSKESAKTSGNRCIVVLNKKTAAVHVLLVYAKTDFHGTNETVWWKCMVRDNYPRYKEMITA